mgnify:CR=1 FL=1
MFELKVKIDKYNYCDNIVVVNEKEVRATLLEVVYEEVLASYDNVTVLKSNIIDYVEVKDDTENI